MANPSETDFKALVEQYDQLRSAELDFLNKRHTADKELQLTRFKAAELAARIASLSKPQAPGCW